MPKVRLRKRATVASGPGTYNYMKRSERRAQVIRRARGIFAEKGYRGTTVEDLCSACGIAQGTLYAHFKNKREVFREVIFDAVDKIQTMLEPVQPSEEGLSNLGSFSLENFIEQRTKRVLEAVSENADVFMVLTREWSGLDAEVDEILKRIGKIMLIQAQTDISLARRLGLIGVSDVRLAAFLPLGTILFYITTNLLESEDPDLDEAAKGLTELIIYGLSGKRG